MSLMMQHFTLAAQYTGSFTKFWGSKIAHGLFERGSAKLPEVQCLVWFKAFTTACCSVNVLALDITGTIFDFYWEYLTSLKIKTCDTPRKS